MASHTAVTPYSKSALLAAVAQQPVSIALDADRDVFQYYSGGVMDSTSCGTSPDHAVLVVGYDTSGSSPYWKVRTTTARRASSARMPAELAAILRGIVPRQDPFRKSALSPALHRSRILGAPRGVRTATFALACPTTTRMASAACILIPHTQTSTCKVTRGQEQQGHASMEAALRCPSAFALA